MDDSDNEIYTVTGADGNTLKFTGELVAKVSSEIHEKDRWTEFSLWLTDFNTWILEGIGRTRVKGEKDRFWYVVSSDPGDILDKILGDDSSRLAKRLLKEAFTFLRDCEPYEI